MSEQIVIPTLDPNQPIDNGTPPPPVIVLGDDGKPVEQVNVPPVDPPTHPVDTPPIPPVDPPADIPPTDTNEVEIEGVAYQLDAEGNALKDGVIVYTKDQLEDEGDDYIALIQQGTGVEVIDDAGQPIVFENSVQGLVAREKAIIAKVTKDAQQTAINSLFEANPEINQILNYKKLHGSLEGFDFKTTYNTISFIENDINNHKQLITKELQLKGLSPRDIEITLKGLEIDNSLSVRAKESEAYLITKQTEVDQEQQRQIVEKQRLQTEQLEKTYGVTVNRDGSVKPLNIEGSIHDIVVNKGKIGDYVIPVTGIVVTRDGKKQVITREAIFNYIAITNETGFSQMQIDEYNKSKDNNYKVSKALQLLLGDKHDKSATLVKRIKTLKNTTSKPIASNTISSGDKIVMNLKVN